MFISFKNDTWFGSQSAQEDTLTRSQQHSVKVRDVGEYDSYT